MIHHCINKSLLVYLPNVTMTPLVCISIGYFMALLFRAACSKVSVHLGHCSIDDYPLSQLVGEFPRHAEVCPTGVMQTGVTELNISGNDKIAEIGIAHVVQTNITSKLKAAWCGVSYREMESLAGCQYTRMSLTSATIVLAMKA